MGAAASLQGLPDEINEQQFKDLAGKLYSPSLFQKLRGTNGLITKQTLIDFTDKSTYVFLTHDWSIDELGRDNHERVRLVNKALQSRGLKTWFDSDKMAGDVKEKMTDGIDTTCCVIVFVTQNYMDKVAGKGPKGMDDNCLYEFR